MACVGCNGLAVEMIYGQWCDTCGGLAIRPGVLLLRHVATVEGAGGRYPIVYDLSTSDYSACWPRPKDAEDRGSLDPDGFRSPPVYTVHGTLDAVIAVMQPQAKGEAEEWPSLEAARSSTDEEKVILNAGI